MTIKKILDKNNGILLIIMLLNRVNPKCYFRFAM